jgi:hypothetical protein
MRMGTRWRSSEPFLLPQQLLPHATVHCKVQRHACAQPRAAQALPPIGCAALRRWGHLRAGRTATILCVHARARAEQ